MRYRIDLKYLYGWDDACWSEEMDGKTKPIRFQSVDDAEAALEEFFSNVKAAVIAGDMDTEAVPDDYRIAEVDRF